MMTLRMTGPTPDERPPAPAVGRRPAFAYLLPFGLSLGLACLTGCTEHRAEDQPAPHAYRANMTPPLPPPATDRIDYDDQTRTLTFYDLQGPGRWMVHVGGAIYPAGPDHRLPEGVDPDDTFVSYTRPGGLTSGHVSLRQIQAAHQMHNSRP
jgi:hypothetical protein